LTVVLIAHLYIIPESFQHNNVYTKDEIQKKVKTLAVDVSRIHKFKNENKIFANFADVYKIKFIDGITLYEILCEPIKLKTLIERDVLNYLQQIFEKAASTNITSAEVTEVLLGEHDETICHGLIAFHPVNNVKPENLLLYGFDSWVKFRRHFLGLYPTDPGTFIDNCSKYFVNLFFHERNKVVVEKILKGFSQKIITHLGHLNDVFFLYRNEVFDNESVKYKTFSLECKLDEEAAAKDKNAAKSKLEFEFTSFEGKPESIVCYPHLRLCKSDDPDDGEYYFNRIYFHEGVSNIENGRILIGHIGGHL
jgi:hypothetical protein